MYSILVLVILAGNVLGQLESDCGSVNWNRNIKCYRNSTEELKAYETSKAVVRIIAHKVKVCTGFLVGNEGHMVTNEHCISSTYDVENMVVELMAEGEHCESECDTRGACGGKKYTNLKLVKANAELDYSLLQFVGEDNPALEFGYMTLQVREGALGEEVYVPQHPSGFGKQISMYLNEEKDKVKLISLDVVNRFGSGFYGYLGFTDSGSSGSPIVSFNSHTVLAVHRGGGCPNTAIPAHYIVNDIRTSFPDITDTIYAEHNRMEHRKDIAMTGKFSQSVKNESENRKTISKAISSPERANFHLRISKEQVNATRSIKRIMVNTTLLPPSSNEQRKVNATRVNNEARSSTIVSSLQWSVLLKTVVFSLNF